MSSHGGSSDTELTPGKRPAALSSLFGAPSPPDTGAAPSGSNLDFAASTLSAGGGDAKDFIFPQSSAPSPDLCPRAPPCTPCTPWARRRTRGQRSGRQVQPGLPELDASLTSTLVYTTLRVKPCFSIFSC